MKSVLSIVFIVICLAATAQKTAVINDPEARPRTLNASFSGISVEDGITLYLSQGTESVAVSSDLEFDGRFKTTVKDGVLKIYFDNEGINWRGSKRKLVAYVSFRELNKLSGSGGASVHVPVSLNVDELEMKFTSGSLFKGKLNAKELEVMQDSGSNIEIEGNAGKIRIDASAGAIFKGFDLAVDYCNAKASSGAMIRILINKELEAKANSGGAIRYKGNASIIDADINSGGIIKKA